MRFPSTTRREGPSGERALRGNLRRKAKRICGACAVDLQMRACFPGESLCHIVRRRRQGPQFKV